MYVCIIPSPATYHTPNPKTEGGWFCGPTELHHLPRAPPTTSISNPRKHHLSTCPPHYFGLLRMMRSTARRWSAVRSALPLSTLDRLLLPPVARTSIGRIFVPFCMVLLWKITIRGLNIKIIPKFEKLQISFFSKCFWFVFRTTRRDTRQDETRDDTQQRAWCLRYGG